MQRSGDKYINTQPRMQTGISSNTHSSKHKNMSNLRAYLMKIKIKDSSQHDFL